MFEFFLFCRTESDYMRSLQSLMKERVASGLSPHGKTIGTELFAEKQ